MRCDSHHVSRVAFVLAVCIAAPFAVRADPPKHTLRIVDDVPAGTDIDAVREWRAEVAEFRSLLEQVEPAAEGKPAEYTFRQFEIIKKGSGDWLSLMHRAWYQASDANAASQIRPPSKCDWCPLSHVRRLFLETVQAKLFDTEHGLYRPYAVTQCVRGRLDNVAIAVQPSNGLRLEPDILYFVGEWIQLPGRPRRLVMSLVSLDDVSPGADRLHATFEVKAPNEDIRDRFRIDDCNGVPLHSIVLVPRLVVPLPEGTRNDKVQ